MVPSDLRYSYYRFYKMLHFVALLQDILYTTLQEGYYLYNYLCRHLDRVIHDWLSVSVHACVSVLELFRMGRCV